MEYHELAAGFDNALLVLRDDLIDDLLERLPQEYHDAVEQLVFEFIERGRDAVDEIGASHTP